MNGSFAWTDTEEFVGVVKTAKERIDVHTIGSMGLNEYLEKKNQLAELQNIVKVLHAEIDWSYKKVAGLKISKTKS